MYIGIDYGTKRVGIAVSDESGKVAFPLEVVGNDDALTRAEELVKERGSVLGIVIGESRDFSGAENPVMAEAREFADELARATGVTIFFEPEFLTSAQASRRGRGENPRNADKRSGATSTTTEKLDASAAAIILQSFLDKQNHATINRMEENNKETEQGTKPAEQIKEVKIEPTISIDDFHKIDIRIGEIKSAERVPDTDKLMRLVVAFGEEERQVVSGIATYFSDPQMLVGKKVAFAYNLAPRVIRGLESKGMILAVHDANGFSLLETQGVGSGTKVG